MGIRPLFLFVRQTFDYDYLMIFSTLKNKTILVL